MLAPARTEKLSISWNPEWFPVDLLESAPGFCRISSSRRLSEGVSTRLTLNDSLAFGEVQSCHDSGGRYDVTIRNVRIQSDAGKAGSPPSLLQQLHTLNSILKRLESDCD
jgi:hypothetical protein